MDYKELLIDFDFFKLKVILNEKKGKILRTEILKNGIKIIEKTDNDLINLIKDYFYGRINKFDLSLLDFINLNDFERDTLIKLSEVPRGKVVTYKKLSEMVKKDKAYRLVGNVLSKNPFPIVVPCHRVIRSDCYVGEFGNGKDLKVKLLEFEGVKFEKNYFVSKEFIL